MNLNLNIAVPVILLAVCMVAWLVYRNVKDEKNFEQDIDEKDDLEEERQRKETKKPL